MKNTFSILTAGLLVLGISVVAVPAYAARAVHSTDGAVRVASSTPASPAKMQGEQKKAHTEVDKRIADLNKAITRTSEMTRLSDSDKATVQTALQTIVANLTTLAGKVDTDTDADSLKTDVASITKDFRVYALVIPRTHIIATADRIITIAGTLNIVGQKLQSRVGAATGAQATSLQSTLQDMSAKVIDAQAQAQSATQMVASLQPDAGDAAVMKSNTQALKDAQAKIKTAQADLVAAQKDARTIQKALKKLPVATSTVPTITQ